MSVEERWIFFVSVKNKIKLVYRATHEIKELQVNCRKHF